MAQRTVLDPLTGVKCNLITTHLSGRVCVSSEVKEHIFIKDSFPKLLEAPNYEYIPTDIKIWHKIETVGSPVYCKPTPLSRRSVRSRRTIPLNHSALG